MSTLRINMKAVSIKGADGLEILNHKALVLGSSISKCDHQLILEADTTEILFHLTGHDLWNVAKCELRVKDATGWSIVSPTKANGQPPTAFEDKLLYKVPGGTVDVDYYLEYGHVTFDLQSDGRGPATFQHAGGGGGRLR